MDGRRGHEQEQLQWHEQGQWHNARKDDGCDTSKDEGTGAEGGQRLGGHQFRKVINIDHPSSRDSEYTLRVLLPAPCN